MSDTIDKFLKIMRIINASAQPMTAQQIAKAVEMNVRTVQRHTSRLVTEGLIDFESRDEVRGYQFMKLGAKA